MSKYKVTSAFCGKYTIHLPYTLTVHTFENKYASVIVDKAVADEFERTSGFIVEELQDSED